METLPGAVHLVRYEALVQNPDETLRALLDFCELPQDQIMLKYARETLAAPPAKRPVTLNPSIQQVFNETMSAMGY